MKAGSTGGATEPGHGHLGTCLSGGLGSAGSIVGLETPKYLYYLYL